MKPFIINTYDYGPWSGGVKVMHKLCDVLNKNGYPSYIMPIHPRNSFTSCSDYYTPLITNDLLKNLDDCIVLYPEGIKDNPLNAKNVVRWMLATPPKDVYQTYSKSDVIYWFMDYYYNEDIGQKNNILYLVELHQDIFYNKKYEKRSGSCYTIRKGKPKKFVHPSDSIFLSYVDVGDLSKLSELYNRTEKFYSYDDYTFLSVQAAMCGCISIVIPNEDISKEKWLNGSRLNKYGIAFGEDDISRAIETIPQMYEEIENVKNEINQNVIDFAENCVNLFK